MFYSVQETVTKMTSTDWSDSTLLLLTVPVVLFVYISCAVCCFIVLK